MGALPERYRKARNIQEGYEIRLSAGDGGQWVKVTRAFHISAPLKVSTFDTEGAGVTGHFSVHPDVDVMSRRPAEVQPHG